MVWAQVTGYNGRPLKKFRASSKWKRKKGQNSQYFEIVREKKKNGGPNTRPRQYEPLFFHIQKR